MIAGNGVLPSSTSVEDVLRCRYLVIVGPALLHDRWRGRSPIQSCWRTP
ncbi:MAG: hypothetical protein U0800_13200 [Isosphaeraceae bacterium]